MPNMKFNITYAVHKHLSRRWNDQSVDLVMGLPRRYGTASSNEQ
jgi:hypothetical protein